MVEVVSVIIMPYQTEALSWLLRNKNEAAFAGNRFRRTSDATEAVERLYAAGATRVDVWVGYDEPSRIKRDGGEYADTLFVFGDPKNEELYHAIRSLEPDNWEPEWKFDAKKAALIKPESAEPLWTLWWD